MMTLTRIIAIYVNMRATDIAVALGVKIAVFFEGGPTKVD